VCVCVCVIGVCVGVCMNAHCVCVCTLSTCIVAYRVLYVSTFATGLVLVCACRVYACDECVRIHCLRIVYVPSICVSCVSFCMHKVYVLMCACYLSYSCEPK
jgi:hypothetical protein